MDVVEKKDLKIFLALLTFVLVVAGLCLALLFSTNPEFTALPILIAIPVAMYLADFMSGILHFLVDYTPNKTGIGLDKLYYYKGNKLNADYLQMRKDVLKKAGFFQQGSFFFKHHHLVKPKHIALRPVFTTFIPTIPISLIFFSLSMLSVLLKAPSIIGLTFILSGLIVFWAQYLHSVTHGRETIGLIRWLQAKGILLNRHHHAKHHKHPDLYFCFVNGWADGLVNIIVNFCFNQGWFKRESLAPPVKESPELINQG